MCVKTGQCFNAFAGDQIEYYSNTLRAWQRGEVSQVASAEVHIQYGD
eukprot:SAG31_NODE_46230_length_255_cov_0.839744_1_plen_46_part_01